MNYKTRVPLESHECKTFFEYSDYQPILRDFLFHVPNGGFRNKLEALEFKRQGLRGGVSDYHLPYPCHGYSGLWIEMKRIKKGLSKVSDSQKEWLKRMKSVGYAVGIAYGAKEAIQISNDYLNGVFVSHDIK